MSYGVLTYTTQQMEKSCEEREVTLIATDNLGGIRVFPTFIAAYAYAKELPFPEDSVIVNLQPIYEFCEGGVGNRKHSDYIFCEDCDCFCDFWKYDHDLDAAGHLGCNVRFVNDEELMECIACCAENGCFTEEQGHGG